MARNAIKTVSRRRCSTRERPHPFSGRLIRETGAVHRRRRTKTRNLSSVTCIMYLEGQFHRGARAPAGPALDIPTIKFGFNEPATLLTGRVLIVLCHKGSRLEGQDDCKTHRVRAPGRGTRPRRITALDSFTSTRTRTTTYKFPPPAGRGRTLKATTPSCTFGTDCGIPVNGVALTRP
ncbi:hypothetical protein EVAR_59069_1 [Eumeta japonica]|uniref:Uncharacterized protein n=1 Tax=Eumeta variegata TaxID=151549 RepID=A0A4C1YEU2_EUMVA|nr:hypothetical protein EVAR_59069_1 [Eumeta japonica]